MRFGWIAVSVGLVVSLSACKTLNNSEEKDVAPQSSVLNDRDVAGLEWALKSRGASMEKGRAVAVLNIPASTKSVIEEDGENALIQAAYSTLPGKEKNAQFASAILENWASTNQDFTGQNGFLSPAWGVGAMARAGWILKKFHPQIWSRIEAKVVPWMVATAEREWLPRSPGRSVPNGKPQLLDKWEKSNASNRSITAIEATIHVARLAGDQAWMNYAVTLYQEYLPKLITDASGTNTDGSRDAWHQQAGLAAAAQIVLIMQQYGVDLSGLNNKALLASSKKYAQQALENPIPFWPAIAKIYGNVPEIPSQLTSQQQSGFYLKPCFSWGLLGLLY